MKMNLYSKTIIAALTVCLSLSSSALAQNERDNNLIRSGLKGWEFELKAGVNLGGAAPLPLPREIRKIKSFSPKFNGTLEGTATYWLTDENWGLSAGLKLENRGMETGAEVKNYHTKVVKGDQTVEGYFSGYNRTRYSAAYLTLPIMANYRLGERWKVRAGLSCSVLLDGSFDGYVKDGVLRNGTPIGERVTFRDDSRGTFDFGDELKPFQWGAVIGGSWRAYKHFSVMADLNWGCGDIFKGSFKTISFSLLPIFCDLGFSYTF
jgi:hypothetical protein